MREIGLEQFQATLGRIRHEHLHFRDLRLGPDRLLEL